MSNRLISKSQLRRITAQTMKCVTAPGYVPPKKDPPKPTPESLTDAQLQMWLIDAGDARSSRYTYGELVPELWRRYEETKDELAVWEEND